jgi:hypothetical protein
MVLIICICWRAHVSAASLKGCCSSSPSSSEKNAPDATHLGLVVKHIVALLYDTCATLRKHLFFA